MKYSAVNLRRVTAGGPYSQIPGDVGKSHLLSSFFQDSVRLRESLTLSVGMRWELTPPLDGNLNLSGASGVQTGDQWKTLFKGELKTIAPWPMRYGQVAPRVGVAYRLPVLDLVLRGGAGLFLDTRLGPAVNPIGGAPFNLNPAVDECVQG